jgi:excisionase family DNA binding protein
MKQNILIEISVSELEISVKKWIWDVLLEFQKNEGKSKSNSELLTRNEVSKLLNVTLATLHNWNKQGKLTPKKIGTRILYSKEQVMYALEDIDRLKYKNAYRTVDCVNIGYHKRLSTATFKTINL